LRLALRRDVFALAAFFMAGLGGCSWLVGVSDDPVVLAPEPVVDAADEPDTASVPDSAVDAADAPEDVDVE